LSLAALESINNGFNLLIYSAPPEQQIALIEKLNMLINPAKTNYSGQRLKQKILNFTPAVINLNENKLQMNCTKSISTNIKIVNLNNKIQF